MARPSGIGGWSAAQAVTGTSHLITADVEAVSCAPRAECTAVGDTDNGGFVVSENNGTWSKPRQMPAFAWVNDVSCPASGSCLITGIYSGDNTRGYIAEEKRGTWGKSVPIKGLAKLGPLEGRPTIVSCASPGNCTVTGTYGTGTEANPTISTFVSDESSGVWHSAIAVPGLSALNVGGDAEPNALACASPGNCTLVGFYTASAQSPSQTPLGNRLVWVASEVNGTWYPAARLPGIAALVRSGIAMVESVACPSPGDCVVVGNYAASQDPRSNAAGAFMASQSSGTWLPARSVPGMDLMAIACQSAGTCTAGGADAKARAAVIHEIDGAWGRPVELPGAAGLAYKGRKARNSWVTTLACPGSTDCAVGGVFHFSIGSKVGQEIFVAGEANGRWAAARVPDGIVSLDAGAGAQFGSLGSMLNGSNHGLSCASESDCAGGGFYVPPPGSDSGAFVLTETALH
jgi:hypothetical protein